MTIADAPNERPAHKAIGRYVSCVPDGQVTKHYGIVERPELGQLAGVLVLRTSNRRTDVLRIHDDTIVEVLR